MKKFAIIRDFPNLLVTELTGSTRAQRHHLVVEVESRGQITPEFISGVRAQHQAVRAQLQGAHDAAGQLFDEMPLGKQVLWEKHREAVQKCILAGDLVKARQIIETTPELYPGMEDDRAVFLALFQQ